MTRLFAAGLAQRIALTAQYLGWSPDTFWSATPTECNTALADPHQDPTAAGSNPISRVDLEALMERENNG